MDRVQKLKEFLTENPEDSFIQHALALEFIKAGDDEEAQKLFENVLQRDPGYVGSYYHLAKLLERRGDATSAIQWYERGMAEAQKAGEKKAYDELKSAYEELTF